MAKNTYYQSIHWQNLRRLCLERDGYRCTVPGCGSSEGLTADHIMIRPNIDTPTAADRIENLRTLCGFHDKQVKEMANGQRRRGGRTTNRITFDAKGWPV